KMKDEFKITGTNFPGTYKKDKTLGFGAGGEVFRFLDKDNHSIAIKEIHIPKDRALSSLESEAGKEAKFMEKIHGFGEVIVEDNHIYIAMPELIGEKMNTFVSKATSDAELLNMAIQFCKSLEELHKKNLTHGDLMYGTDNFLINKDMQVLFLDFSKMREHKENALDQQMYIDRDIKSFVDSKIIPALKSKSSSTLTEMLSSYSEELIMEKNLQVSDVIQAFTQMRSSVLEQESISTNSSYSSFSIFKPVDPPSSDNALQQTDKNDRKPF
ncbi:MAG: protein kinase family protein, partial [Gammaproteobacteria bacterium]|nr:protein kinase family protein [Gammaproteobacteria bacterium]